MSTLLVHHGGQTRAIPLAPSTLVGRGTACLARVDDPAVPVYWLEFRWRSGAWCWRALAAEDRTRALGSARDQDWWVLPHGRARPARVTLDGVLHVEVVEGGPPRPFLLDVVTRETVRGEALSEWVEVRGEALLPLESEGETRRTLAEGEAFSSRGRTWQVHGVSALEPTLRARVDLTRAGAALAVDLSPLRATLLQGDAAVEIHGEPVRVLAVYLHAAQRGTGWLDVTTAWAAWRALGGNPESPAERMAWERGRVRAAFARAGVAGVDRLFEVLRDRDGVRVRLGVAPG